MRTYMTQIAINKVTQLFLYKEMHEKYPIKVRYTVSVLIIYICLIFFSKLVCHFLRQSKFLSKPSPALGFKVKLNWLIEISNSRNFQKVVVQATILFENVHFQKAFYVWWYHFSPTTLKKNIQKQKMTSKCRIFHPN